MPKAIARVFETDVHQIVVLREDIDDLDDDNAPYAIEVRFEIDGMLTQFRFFYESEEKRDNHFDSDRLESEVVRLVERFTDILNSDPDAKDVLLSDE